MVKPASPQYSQDAQSVKRIDIGNLFKDQQTDSVGLVNTVVREAINLAASDILFEPRKNHLLLRVRIDGVLYEIGEINSSAHAQVSARIKILCGLDTTKKFKTQEGQFSAKHEKGDVDLRVAIVDTVFGELIVIRIHRKNTIVMELSELGFSEKSFNDYVSVTAKKRGLILVCGPTGSGKTTTLYSTIARLNTSREFNVMTVEDPVEFKFDGLNQMQTDTNKDFTFAAGLKTILRLSPDIILVGEIRDAETSKIAIESGLTGQLVLSTIHADDAVGALFRLMDLGIEPYLINSSVTGIVAQRLLRKNCTACLEAHTPDENELEVFLSVLGRIPEQLYRGTGCKECQNSAFKGRIGVYEVLPVNARVRDLIRNRTNEEALRNTLAKDDYFTMLKDGLTKCEQGVTTVAEVLRNSITQL